MIKVKSIGKEARKKAVQKAKYERWKKEKPEQLKAMQRKALLKHRLKKPWLVYNHTEANKARIKTWIAMNPERIKIIRKRAKAKRKNLDGEYSFAEWQVLKKEYNFTCPSCLKSEPDIELHADHIIPIIKGGWNEISNIQPLCKSCNSSKYTKIIAYLIMV